MPDAYNILLEKLNEFIRKYYKNQLIKGFLYGLALLLSFYLIIVLTENFAYFGIFTRTVIFYSYIGLSLFVLWRLIITPLFKLYDIGKTISHEYAAQIISRHFAEIKDKLINTLQLKQLSDNNPKNIELIRASIDQRIAELKPIPFVSAIDFLAVKKGFRYAAIPLIIIIIILLTSPSSITEPTTRILKHHSYFEKPTLFRFKILNNKLEVVQHEDFQLMIKTEGPVVPDKAYIKIDNTLYRLTKENNILFSHDFKNVQKNIVFKIVTEDYTTPEYELKVLPRPVILNFEISLDYPKYIRKKNEVLENTGDLVIPCGTKVMWNFLTKDTRQIIIAYEYKKHNVRKDEKADIFRVTDSFVRSLNYYITSSNEFLTGRDSLIYSINIIPDEFPGINVEEYRDSVYEQNFYFNGMIKDDYGFNKLTFNYKEINPGVSDSLKGYSSVIPVNTAVTYQPFSFHFDISTLSVNPGDEIEYYFEVWDNDGVNGSKSTRSQKMTYKLTTVEELKQNTEEKNEQIKDDIAQTIKEAKKLQEQADELNKKFLEKNKLTWQEKKQVEDLLKKHEELQKKIENIQNLNEEKSVKEDQYAKPNEELLKKQEQLNKLFEEVMTDEMKELFEKLQEMLDELNKDEVKNMLDKIKFNTKDIEKQLDRNLEIFKQLELEKKLNEAIENLDKLAEKQENLSEKTKEEKDPDNMLKQEQEKINEEFNNVRKDLDDVQKKNKELEYPNDLKNTDKEEESIEGELKNSSDLLENAKNKKASESQKNASDQMKSLSEKLNDMMEQMQAGAMAEDIDALRQILDNLVKVSFAQEELISKTSVTKFNDPQYVKNIEKQKGLKDDLKMIEDSLFALSKRQVQIEPIVNKEISDINMNVDKALGYMNDRQASQAAGRQQYVMTSVNNLSLLLSESLENMQNQMMKANCHKKQGSCSNPGNCSKPGNGESSIKSLRQLQEQLNKQIEELGKSMKPGNTNQDYGQKTISEQLARLAAQQEAIRRELQKLSGELKNNGIGNNGELEKTTKDMEKTETDLVNKIISQETLMRQKDILTRLLESEKADRERETDNKRESKEIKNDYFSNQNKFSEYNKLKQKQEELLKTFYPTLKPFYKNKVNEYLYNFED